MQTIIVPGDGASNIKISVYDFETLETKYEVSTITPTEIVDNYKCNKIKEELNWFDKAIKDLPEELKQTAVISPVTRGASGALIGNANNIIDTEDGKHTITYTQPYPEEVEEKFMELVESSEKFFEECGSVAAFPGSTTLIKRLLFESMIRPEIFAKAKAFATFPVVVSGHFLDNNFLKAAKIAGNEHSYWMCHTGARDVRGKIGVPSSLSHKIDRFKELVPSAPFKPYIPLGNIGNQTAKKLDLPAMTKIMSGGHDTCFSHIPILSSFYNSKPEYKNIPILQLEAGTWTMGAQLGGESKLPSNGYKQGIIVQGNVDGEPTVTSMYGGGFDFRQIKDLVEKRKLIFKAPYCEKLIVNVLKNKHSYVLPNINPANKGTGPFPNSAGTVINEDTFYSSGETAYITANLCITATASHHIQLIASNEKSPIIITAGGSKDIYFGKLVATYTGRPVYAGIDKNGNALTETTSLGAAIIGKAGCLDIHPYDVDISSLGIKYNKIEPFEGDLKNQILNYKKEFLNLLDMHGGSL